MATLSLATRWAVTPAVVALLAFGVSVELVRAPSLTRLIVAACLGLCAAVAAAQWPVYAVLGTLLLLPFVGLTRRMLLDYTAWQSADPLLLIAPGVLALLLARLFVLERREFADDRTSKLVLVVMVLFFIQIANPRGGGVAAGVAALMFTVVPLAWYFVGRELMAPRHVRSLFVGLTFIASVIAVYGLFQTWVTFPFWDRAWLGQVTYEALNVGGSIRAFGTFSSSAEYGTFLGIGIVVAVAFVLKGMPQLLPTLPLLGTALFYASIRGAVIQALFAVVVVISARTGSMRRAAVALGVCVVGVIGVFAFAQDSLQSKADSTSDPLVSHQLGGLSDPLDEDASTLEIHLNMFRNGIEHGLLDPLGNGIDSTTLAASRFSSNDSSSSEVDISNVFISLGTIGGLAYLALVISVLWMALRLAVERQDAVSLAALGVLVVVLGQWLNGGFYAVAPLVWLVAGFIVRQSRSSPQ